MAIKGKKRAKGRPRAVGHAPRPFLVPPKTPVLRRPGVQLGLIAILLGIIALIGWGLSNTQRATKQQEAVERFGTQVESALASTGVVQQLPAGPLVLPEMGQVIAGLGQGERVGGLREQAESWSSQASDAAEAIEDIDTDPAELRRAREQMARSLRLYSALASNLGVAAQVEGRVLRDLVTAMQLEFAVAAELFDSGWNTLQEERRRAGMPLEPVGPPQPFPPDFQLPPP